MFVAGWRHALRSEWPFIFIITLHTASLHCNQAEILHGDTKMPLKDQFTNKLEVSGCNAGLQYD